MDVFMKRQKTWEKTTVTTTSTVRVLILPVYKPRNSYEDADVALKLQD